MASHNQEEGSIISKAHSLCWQASEQAAIGNFGNALQLFHVAEIHHERHHAMVPKSDDKFAHNCAQFEEYRCRKDEIRKLLVDAGISIAPILEESQISKTLKPDTFHPLYPGSQIKLDLKTKESTKFEVESKSERDSSIVVGGMEIAKNTIRDYFLLPALHPNIYSDNGCRPLRTVRTLLLFGEVGNGLERICQAVASEAKAKFYKFSPPDFDSRYFAEGASLVRSAFLVARQNAPSIVFIDEIDGLLSTRTRSNTDSQDVRMMKAEFMVQISALMGGQEHVLLVSATTRPCKLDSAFMSRIESCVYVALPTLKERQQIFKALIVNLPNSLTDEDFKTLARSTEGYFGTDIEKIVSEARQYIPHHLHEADAKYYRGIGNNDNIKYVAQQGRLHSQSDSFNLTMEYMKKAMKSVPRSISEVDAQLLAKFNSEFGAQEEFIEESKTEAELEEIERSQASLVRYLESRLQNRKPMARVRNFCFDVLSCLN